MTNRRDPDENISRVVKDSEGHGLYYYRLVAEYVQIAKLLRKYRIDGPVYYNDKHLLAVGLDYGLLLLNLRANSLRRDVVYDIADIIPYYSRGTNVDYRSRLLL